MSERRIETAVLETTETGHLVELRYDDGESDRRLVCAAHGGAVEPGTTERALELATQLRETVCWTCLGYDEAGAFDVYHPPSSSFDREGYPLLDAVAGRQFQSVLSLHGLGDDEVLVGGAADPARKRRVQEALADTVSVPVRTVSEGEYAGTSADNFVNWLAADGGLQLELGPTPRGPEGDAVVDRLASLCRDDIL